MEKGADLRESDFATSPLSGNDLESNHPFSFNFAATSKLSFLKDHYIPVCYFKITVLSLLWVVHVTTCFLRRPPMLTLVTSIFLCTNLVGMHIGLFYYFAKKVSSSQKLTTLLLALPFLSGGWVFITLWVVQLIVPEGSVVYFWVCIPIVVIYACWVLTIAFTLRDITPLRTAMREIPLSKLFRAMLFITEVDAANRKIELMKCVIVDCILFVYTSVAAGQDPLTNTTFQQIVVLMFALNFSFFIIYGILKCLPNSSSYQSVGEFLFCVCSWQVAYSRYSIMQSYFHFHNYPLGIFYFIEMIYQIRTTYLHGFCFVNSIYGEETLLPQQASESIELTPKV